MMTVAGLNSYLDRHGISKHTGGNVMIRFDKLKEMKLDESSKVIS